MKKNLIFLTLFMFTAFLLMGAVSAANNNSSNSTMKVVSNGAYKDLVITSINSWTMGGKGKPIPVSYTIKNQGTSSVKTGFITNFYLVPSTSLGKKIYIGHQYFSTLSTGKSITKLTYLTVPWTISPGYYYIAAKVDGSNIIPESKEYNNVRVTKSKTSIYSYFDYATEKLYSIQSQSYVNFGWIAHQRPDGTMIVDCYTLYPWNTRSIHEVYYLKKIYEDTLRIILISPTLKSYTGESSITTYKDTYSTEIGYYLEVMRPFIKKYRTADPEMF